MMVIYLPVFTYLGWHYTLTGAFVRGAIWWPMIIKLALRDARGWLPVKTKEFAPERSHGDKSCGVDSIVSP